MKSKTSIILIVLLMSTTVTLYAQTDSTRSDSSVKIQSTIRKNSSAERKGFIKQIPRFNLIKINLPALLFKSYSLQYERVLNRKFSIAVQYRLMPETGIPFKSDVLKLVGDDDPDTKKTIEDFRMSNYAITPEVRLYLSKKGFGRGFYLAPFYRYASFTSNALNVSYTDESDAEQNIKMSGKLTSNTFGLALGAQNFIGKHVCLTGVFSVLISAQLPACSVALHLNRCHRQSRMI